MCPGLVIALRCFASLIEDLLDKDYVFTSRF